MKQENTNFDKVFNRNEVPTLKFDDDMLNFVFGNKNLWPSWVADMDFAAADCIQKALKNRLAHGVFGYESRDKNLAKAIIKWYAKRYGFNFTANQIQFSPRTIASIAALINLFSQKGNGIIIQPPVFYDFKIIISANERITVKNPLKFKNNNYQIDFENLKNLAKDKNNKILILCNPHNPIGKVWDKKDLSKIIQICAKYDIFIIADEIHGDIVYEKKYIPIASISKTASQICATCISPIKSFNLAGVCNSMIVIQNKQKAKQVKKYFDQLQINKNNVFSNAAMLAAYSEGEKWLGDVIEYLKQNIKMLDEYLQQKIPDIKLIKPEGTYLIWLDFRNLGFEAKDLENFLIQKVKVASNPGHWFGRQGAGFVRINIACPKNILLKFLKNLEIAVNTIKNKD